MPKMKADACCVPEMCQSVYGATSLDAIAVPKGKELVEMTTADGVAIFLILFVLATRIALAVWAKRRKERP